MTFKDHFSAQAEGYARYRPRYPEALFDWLAAEAPGREAAWDCGTGSGQAAHALAARFARVVATDASADQIAHAAAHARVEYRVAPAEAPGLPPAAFDACTVAQALHWFDIPRFAAAVRAALRPGGLVAAWTYQLSVVEPTIDALVVRLYDTITGPYWPPERVHVENGYRSLAFPFDECAALPAFELTADWTAAEYAGYLRTWSSVKRYEAAEGHDPVALIEADLTAAWGVPGQVRRVVWPLALRAGRV